MTKQHQKRVLPILALIFAYVLWGANTPVIKLGLRTVPLPLYLAVTLMGGSILTAIFTYRSWKPIKPRDLALIIIGSLIGITLGNTALLTGLKVVPATNAALIGLFSPFLLFILSIEFLRERLNLRVFIGILVAFMGAAIIIGKPWQSTSTSQAVIVSNLLIVLDALCSVTVTLLFKPLLKRVNPYQLAAVNLFAGTLPVALYSLRYFNHLSPAVAGKSGYLAMGFNVIAVAGANCLFYYALKKKRAQEVGIFQYVHPVVTAIAAWLILSERPNSILVAGGALILGGIYFAEFGALRKAVIVSRK